MNPSILENVDLTNVKKKKVIQPDGTYSLRATTSILGADIVQNIFDTVGSKIEGTTYIFDGGITKNDIGVLNKHGIFDTPFEGTYNYHNFKTSFDKGSFETSILEEEKMSSRSLTYYSYLVYKIPVHTTVTSSIIFDRYFKPSENKKVVTAFGGGILAVGIVFIILLLGRGDTHPLNDLYKIYGTQGLLVGATVIFLITAIFTYITLSKNKEPAQVIGIETVNNIHGASHTFSDKFTTKFIEWAKGIYRYNQCKILLLQDVVYIVRSFRYTTTDTNIIAITSDKEETTANLLHLTEDVENVKKFCNDVLPEIR